MFTARRNWEAYIYEPFFTVEMVTESGEGFENWWEGWYGRGNGREVFGQYDTL
jgi:hypothetical protein